MCLSPSFEATGRILNNSLFFSAAGINESYQMGLFQVLAAILHLGNVDIKDRDSDSSIIPVRTNTLHNTLNLYLYVIYKWVFGFSSQSSSFFL